jgi:hypothetical protein
LIYLLLALDKYYMDHHVARAEMIYYKPLSFLLLQQVLLFDTGVIIPVAFIEYGASNLQQGEYSYYLTSEPNVKGELIVSAAGGK